MPVAGELQGRYAVHVMWPRGHAQAAVAVVDRVGQADIHAAQRVDHLDETEEVHLHVVVDLEPGVPFDGAHHEPWSADAERRVDLAPAMARYVDPGITRQADDLHITVVGRHVHHHERVRVGLARGAANVEQQLLPPRQAGAFVDARDQDVQRPAGRRARGSRVDPPEVAVDVAGQAPGASRGQQDQRRHSAGGHEHGAALPRPPARGDSRHQLLLRGRRAGPAPASRMPGLPGRPQARGRGRRGPGGRGRWRIETRPRPGNLGLVS